MILSILYTIENQKKRRTEETAREMISDLLKYRCLIKYVCTYIQIANNRNSLLQIYSEREISSFQLCPKLKCFFFFCLFLLIVFWINSFIGSKDISSIFNENKNANHVVPVILNFQKFNVNPIVFKKSFVFANSGVSSEFICSHQ